MTRKEAQIIETSVRKSIFVTNLEKKKKTAPFAGPSKKKTLCFQTGGVLDHQQRREVHHDSDGPRSQQKRQLSAQQPDLLVSNDPWPLHGHGSQQATPGKNDQTHSEWHIKFWGKKDVL